MTAAPEPGGVPWEQVGTGLVAGVAFLGWLVRQVFGGYRAPEGEGKPAAVIAPVSEIVDAKPLRDTAVRLQGIEDRLGNIEGQLGQQEAQNAQIIAAVQRLDQERDLAQRLAQAEAGRQNTRLLDALEKWAKDKGE